MHEVKVKYGKPILQIPFHTLRLIGLVDILINAISVVYIFELFSLAGHVKKKYGQYVELLKENSSSLSVLIAAAGLFILPFNILTIFTLYKVFHSTRKLYGLFLRICCILSICLIVVLFIMIIVGLSMGNPPEASRLQNLINSLANYSDDSIIKGKIDRMQVEFQCCGASNYTDWYSIEWYDKNLARKTEVTVIGEAPFSCCNFHSNYPCVHHGIEQGAGAYKYSIEANFSLSATGCFEAIQEKKLRTIWEIVGYIFALIFLQAVAFIPIRLIQTAYLGRGRIVSDSHLYTCWIIGCLQDVKNGIQEAPPVPPLPPELMNFD